MEQRHGEDAGGGGGAPCPGRGRRVVDEERALLCGGIGREPGGPGEVGRRRRVGGQFDARVQRQGARSQVVLVERERPEAALFGQDAQHLHRGRRRGVVAAEREHHARADPIGTRGRLELLVLLRERRLCGLALTDVAEHAGEEPLAFHHHLGDGEAERDERPVLAHPLDLSTDADDLGDPGLAVGAQVGVVERAVRLRHEHLDVVAEHLVGAIPEDLLGGPVERRDLSRLVDDHDAVERGVEHGARAGLEARTRRIIHCPIGSDRTPLGRVVETLDEVLELSGGSQERRLRAAPAVGVHSMRDVRAPHALERGAEVRGAEPQLVGPPRDDVVEGSPDAPLALRVQAARVIFAEREHGQIRREHDAPARSALEQRPEVDPVVVWWGVLGSIHHDARIMQASNRRQRPSGRRHRAAASRLWSLTSRFWTTRRA